MGLLSSFKRFSKKLWQGIKAVARIVVRIAWTLWTPFTNIWDLHFGFLNWPPKKLRIQILILSSAPGKPVVDPANPALQAMIAYATKVFKDRLNVKLHPYSDTFIQVIDEPAPHYALITHCVAGAGALTIDEAGDAGEYFAQHLAGWNAIPISITVPVTVFIVENIIDRAGCSLGPLTDYIVLRANGIKDASLMAHELGHACNLVWHSDSVSNLMWPGNTRGDLLNWFQRNLFRSSRHVRYI
ncbi:MAG TPA: hypothetical protein VLB44_10200 [Kofleriaceae bacterium]|nr:hypothetical protein [Kofleriaceae bacterium]